VKDSSVVDQNVGASQIFPGPLDGLFDVFLFGNVALHGVDFTFSAFIQLFSQLLHQILF
jgi:hypothetical protein